MKECCHPGCELLLFPWDDEHENDCRFKLSKVRCLFDAIAKEYPVLEEKLSANSEIVLDKTFESAIVKLQQGKIESLSSSELRSVKHLKIQSQDVEDITDEHNQSISFAERILKKQKIEEVISSSSYVDLRFLIPTSNICERLFSEAGFCFNERRMSVLPINAESQMFLHLNSSLWDIDIVKDILSETQG
jgi:hypothetical protein